VATVALIVVLLVGAGATYVLVSLNRTATNTTASTSAEGAVVDSGTTTSTTATTAATATATNTTATAATMNASQQVRSAYAAHLQNIGSENATVLGSEYERNATLQLTGNVSGLAGQYQNNDSIRTFYQSLFDAEIGFPTINVTDVDYTVSVSGTATALVDSNFTLYGNDTGFSFMVALGGVTVYVANIRGDVSYVRHGDDWLISNETLDFLAFDVCPSMSSPDCSSLLSSPQ
jgi:hypothetical protein